MTTDEKLAEIAKILDFGHESDAYYNLEGALFDIEHTGTCDKVCIHTLKRVQEQINKVSQILES